MIYDYHTFDFTRNAENIYKFFVNDYVYSDPRLGKNMKMSVCQFHVRHFGVLDFEDRNQISLVLNSPTTRNLGFQRVICLEGEYSRSPIIRLDMQPKMFEFSIKDMDFLSVSSWTNAVVIIEISYESNEDYYQDAFMKKL